MQRFYVRLTRSEWLFVSLSVIEIHVASRVAGPRRTNATRPVRRAVVIAQVFVWIRKRLFCYHSTATLPEHVISTRRHVNKSLCGIQRSLLSCFPFSPPRCRRRNGPVTLRWGRTTGMRRLSENGPDQRSGKKRKKHRTGDGRTGGGRSKGSDEEGKYVKSRFGREQINFMARSTRNTDGSTPRTTSRQHGIAAAEHGTQCAQTTQLVTRRARDVTMTSCPCGERLTLTTRQAGVCVTLNGRS